MSNTEVGREPIQIVRLRLPKCANTHGTAPCTATQTGDAKCFNTRATCNDAQNYRSNPEGGLAVPDLIKRDEETIASGDLTRTADLFVALDVRFPITPVGTIWEQGGSADNAAYLGITGSNLVFRAGDGTASAPANAAKVTTPFSNVAGKSLTLLAEIDVSADSVTLWAFDPVLLSLTLLGTDTASGSFATWAGTDGGAIGLDGGSNIATGEDGGAFNGVISEVRFYDSTAALADMGEADFRLDLYFGRKQQAKPTDVITVFPMITSISTVGSKINISGGNRNFEPLGHRATVDIEMTDGLSSDILLDEYIVDRTYDPLTRSTFWLKFWNRQKFGKLGALLVIFEGYVGDALADMDTRTYLLERIDFPGNGKARLYCRDVLTRSEINKAQAPVASPGILFTDIDEVVTSITLTSMIEDDYPASGTLRIGKEVMTYSSFLDNGDGTFTFTLILRGTDGSTAEEHDLDDSVQLCLRYAPQRIDAVLRDLLGEYAQIEYQYMDLVGWESEITSFLSAYTLTTLITEPIEVKRLIGEIMEQCSFYMWWDERDQIIKLAAIRGLVVEPPTLGDDKHFLADSISIQEQTDERISQVWFYFNQADPTKKLNERTNYRNVFVNANLEAESQTKYRQRQIREIFSRWIPAEAQALQTASRLINRYEDVPVEISFSLDSKDRTFWVSDTFFIDHHKFVDARGLKETKRIFVVTAAQENHLSGFVKYTARDTTLSGFIFVIVDNSEGDYVGDGSDQFNGAWISDSLGNYSNGDKGARIN